MFLIITPVFLGRFLHFTYKWNTKQEWIYYKGDIKAVINEHYDLTVDTFLNLMMLEEQDIAKSYSREEADWI